MHRRQAQAGGTTAQNRMAKNGEESRRQILRKKARKGRSRCNSRGYIEKSNVDLTLPLLLKSSIYLCYIYEMTPNSSLARDR